MSNEVKLLIDGTLFRYWQNIRIDMALDNIHTAEFNAPWDPDDATSRSTFKPLSFKSLELTINDEIQFSGRMVTPIPTITPDKSVVTVGCYAYPGVLGECTPGAAALPLEFKKQNLHQIAETLAKPFEISIDAQADPGATFDKFVVDPTQKILKTISDLAKQRNQVISNTTDGKLLFWQSITSGNPVARLEQGLVPLFKVIPNFDTSSYYSELTGLKPMNVRSKKSYQITVQNTLFSDVFRPFTFQVEDTKDADTLAAVESKVGRMFGNMISYSVSLPSWRTPSGDLWTPNTYIELKAPGAMIYERYKFLIRQVVLRKTPASETATLGLVLPGAFSGIQPERLPWDE